MRAKKMTLIKPLFRKWWEDYPSLNSAKFTNRNSGNMQLEPCPYKVCYDRDKLEPTSFTEDWKPTGYTLNPPEADRWERVHLTKVIGFMFEKDNGEQAWFHFPINDKADYE